MEWRSPRQISRSALNDATGDFVEQMDFARECVECLSQRTVPSEVYCVFTGPSLIKTGDVRRRESAAAKL